MRGDRSDEKREEEKEGRAKGPGENSIMNRGREEGMRVGRNGKMRKQGKEGASGIRDKGPREERKRRGEKE
jgi:hypothetical protein